MILIKISYEYFTILLELYRNSKERLKEILKAAEEERTVWQEVTEQFNNRFKVPFEIKIENQADVILKEDVLVVFRRISSNCGNSAASHSIQSRKGKWDIIHKLRICYGCFLLRL